MLSKEEATEMVFKIIDNDTTRILPMARMLNTTQDSIMDAMNDKIELNNSFLLRTSQIASVYEENGESYKKLRHAKDPGYRWFEYVLDYPWLYPWTFWINIIICVLLIFAEGFGIIPLSIEGLIYLTAWIFSLFATPMAEPVADSPHKVSQTIKNDNKSKYSDIKYSEKASAQKFIDEKRIYLIDLTRSMEGFNGSENIFGTVKQQLKDAIQSINDTTTEIVLIPFTDRPLGQINKRISNKEELLQYIDELSPKMGDTNILAAWQQGVLQLDSAKVNYMFMLTDGIHNTGEPIESLYKSLQDWHSATKDKYQFAFYVLLSSAAREQEICEIVESSKQMWLVPSLNINTDFILGKMNLNVNIINSNKVKLHLRCTNPEIFNEGFKFNISIPENEYYRIVNASTKLDSEGFLNFEIEKLKPQNQLPVSYKTILKVDYDKEKYPLIFFTPEEYNFTIDNVGTRTMYLKQRISK